MEGGSVGRNWGESPVGVVLIVAESCATRSQRSRLPLHYLALCWSVVWLGTSWKGPGLRQQFSPLEVLMDCAGMFSPSDTAHNPVYFKKMSNVECIDVNQLS